MNKNVKYWTLGVIAAVIVILIAAFTLGNRRTGGEKQSQTAETSAGGGSTVMDHGAMDHNIMEHGAASSAVSQNSADENLDQYLTDQDAIMMVMMREMQDIPKTKNASLDFLHGMIPHHTSAVDMAESYLMFGGENEDLKAIAEGIITTQTDEIKQMQDLIKKYEEDGQTDEDKESAYLEEYNKMFDSHSHHIDTAGVKDVEEAFAQGMIMHHEMAIDMAEAILEYTDYEEIRTLSQNIITVQKQEIEEMKKFLPQ